MNPDYIQFELLLSAVRRLFRTEADPVEQAKAYSELREAMYRAMDYHQDRLNAEDED